ncbi:MFS transporter [Pseudonocardia pini]|uniref:MFS transporter n=1 Tax=Pseudonocardia pini TaxID=2758030 RepID=UPI0015F05D81|nr:MFS transporter [Pseudonocardia pini]
MSTIGTHPSALRGRQSDEWRAGGRTAAFSAIGYGAGPMLFMMTASVFVRPMTEATGWSTTEVLLGPIFIVFFNAAALVVGRLVDRRGIRTIILVGLVPYIALVALMAFLPVTKITFYALGAAIGVFGAFGGQVPFYKLITLWFDKSAGKAFGLLGAGAGVMPILAIPLVTWAVYGAGWKTGYLVLAGFTLLLTIPAVAIGVQVPAGQEVSTAAEATAGAEGRPPVSARTVLTSVRFWIFAFSVLVMYSGASAFTANMQPILLDGGLGVAVATTVTTVFTAGMVVGRLAAGVLLDMVSRYWVVIGMLTLSTLGALTLTQIPALPAVVVGVGALMVALSLGAEGDIMSYFLVKDYGPLIFGVLFSVCIAVAGASGFVFPYLFSGIRESTGSYDAACYLGAACFVVGGLALVVYGLLGRRRSAAAVDEATEA